MCSCGTRIIRPGLIFLLECLEGIPKLGKKINLLFSKRPLEFEKKIIFIFEGESEMYDNI